MLRSKILITVSAFAASLLLVAGHSSAANNTKATGGISISPFIQQINLAPTDSSKTFNLTLTNNTPTLQEILLSSRDFGTLNDTGGILLEADNSYTQKYGLTSWMKLGTDTVVLQPKESRIIPVTVENRQTLQPGGHYAAVVAAVKSLDEATGNHVAVNQQLLSLILLNKQGGEHYALRLVGIENNGNWLHLPSKVKLRFQNPGNVHVIPRGTVVLKNPAGKIISKGIINSESAYVLPESFREIYVPLTKVGGDVPLPGIYRIEVTYRYDGINQTATKSSYLRFINLSLYFLVAILAGIIWRYYRQHKKSNADKVQNSTKKPVKKTPAKPAKKTN